jgi:gentisate 1,2-dioxygenase
MAGNSMLSLHISEMPPRMYKKAHRHSADAFILLLSGEGFSLTWEEVAFHKRRRVDWKAGTLFVPPTFWYHQHLNTGSTPARYLAIDSGPVPRDIGLQFVDQLKWTPKKSRANGNRRESHAPAALIKGSEPFSTMERRSDPATDTFLKLKRGRF